jgi:hypothetical protein
VSSLDTSKMRSMGFAPCQSSRNAASAR